MRLRKPLGKVEMVAVALLGAWVGVSCAGPSSTTAGTAAASSTTTATVVAGVSTSVATSSTTSSVPTSPATIAPTAVPPTSIAPTTTGSGSPTTSGLLTTQAGGSYISLIAINDVLIPAQGNIIWQNATGDGGVQVQSNDLGLQADQSTVNLATVGVYRADFNIAVSDPPQFNIGFILNGQTFASYRGAGGSLSVSLMFTVTTVPTEIRWQRQDSDPNSLPLRPPGPDVGPVKGWASFTLQRVA